MTGKPAELGHTPLRHRLLHDISQQEGNGYRAHVDLVGDKVMFKLDGRKIHGAVTQAIRMLLQLRLIEMSRPKPYEHHVPRTLALTPTGRELLGTWTASHGTPRPAAGGADR
jgi:hypothetical protein